MGNEILQVKHLSKSFGSNVVLRDIDFSVGKGDVISIIGASGSGKSTLLRCINLLETPTHGEIWYQGKNVLDRSVIDEIIPVSDEDAMAAGRSMGRREGVLIGISAGACLHAAIEIAKRDENAGKTIVALMPDSGDRYLSTRMYQD